LKSASERETITKKFPFQTFVFGTADSETAARRQRDGSETAARRQRDGSETAARRQRDGSQTAARRYPQSAVACGTAFFAFSVFSEFLFWCLAVLGSARTFLVVYFSLFCLFFQFGDVFFFIFLGHLTEIRKNGKN